MATTPEPKAKTTDRKLAAKWGDELIEAGWTALPNVIFQRQRALGLDPIDINILLHLAGYWWTSGQDAHPAKKTLAEAMNITPRTVQRRIAQLEAGGLIKRVPRRLSKGGSNTNLYSFAPLIKAAKPYAAEAIAEKEQRKKEAAAKVTRKKPQTLAVIEGGKAKGA